MRPHHWQDPLVSPDWAGWWQRSTLLLRATWQPLLAIQGAAAVVGTAVGGPAVARYSSTATTLTDFSDISPFVEALGWLAFGALVPLPVAAWGLLTGLHLAATRATGRGGDVAASMVAALRRLPAMIGWLLPAIVLIFVGFVLCFVPAFYLAAALSTLPAVVLFERGSGLRRSFRLFHTDLAAALGRIGTLAALCLMATVAANALINPVVAITGSELVSTVFILLAQAVSSTAIGVIAVPFLLTTYADLRSRREHFHTGMLLDRF